MSWISVRQISLMDENCAFRILNSSEFKEAKYQFLSARLISSLNKNSINRILFSEHELLVMTALIA